MYNNTLRSGTRLMVTMYQEERSTTYERFHPLSATYLKNIKTLLKHLQKTERKSKSLTILQIWQFSI